MIKAIVVNSTFSFLFFITVSIDVYAQDVGAKFSYLDGYDEWLDVPRLSNESIGCVAQEQCEQQLDSALVDRIIDGMLAESEENDEVVFVSEKQTQPKMRKNSIELASKIVDFGPEPNSPPPAVPVEPISVNKSKEKRKEGFRDAWSMLSQDDKRTVLAICRHDKVPFRSCTTNVNRYINMYIRNNGVKGIKQTISSPIQKVKKGYKNRIYRSRNDILNQRK